MKDERVNRNKFVMAFKQLPLFTLTLFQTTRYLHFYSFEHKYSLKNHELKNLSDNYCETCTYSSRKLLFISIPYVYVLNILISEFKEESKHNSNSNSRIRLYFYFDVSQKKNFVEFTENFLWIVKKFSNYH